VRTGGIEREGCEGDAGIGWAGVGHGCVVVAGVWFANDRHALDEERLELEVVMFLEIKRKIGVIGAEVDR
jgi:hypothetical protein